SSAGESASTLAACAATARGRAAAYARRITHTTSEISPAANKIRRNSNSLASAEEELTPRRHAPEALQERRIRGVQSDVAELEVLRRLDRGERAACVRGERRRLELLAERFRLRLREITFGLRFRIERVALRSLLLVVLQSLGVDRRDLQLVLRLQLLDLLV